MEIEKQHIMAALNKMVAAGKQLPQMDRIRFSKEPGEERQKVLVETANLWWDLFKNNKIGVERWNKAVDKALMLSGIPKLETQIINPALMSVALHKVEEEYLVEQQTKHEQEKKATFTAYKFPEMGELIKYHLTHHHGEYIPLPAPEIVRSWANRGGLKPDVIEDNLIKLRIYYNFGQYAKRDGTKMPLKLLIEEDRFLRISIVA